MPSSRLNPARVPPLMGYEICALTDQGLVRQNNEDAVAFDRQTGLCLLADGMGGYKAGEVASAMAITLLMQELNSWLLRSAPQAPVKELRGMMKTCVQSANQAIAQAAGSNPDHEGMGTTLVAGVFAGNQLVLGHVGDSRCYRLRGEALLQLTKDHSMLQEQVDAGLMTSEQAMLSPHQNLITRALGVEKSVQVDISEYRVEPGDVYLMCSDGLSDMLKKIAITDILNTPGTLDIKALALVQAANDSGGRDNISVLLVQAGACDSRRGLLSSMLGK